MHFEMDGTHTPPLPRSKSETESSCCQHPPLHLDFKQRRAFPHYITLPCSKCNTNSPPKRPNTKGHQRSHCRMQSTKGHQCLVSFRARHLLHILYCSLREVYNGVFLCSVPSVHHWCTPIHENTPMLVFSCSVLSYPLRIIYIYIIKYLI